MLLASPTQRQRIASKAPRLAFPLLAALAAATFGWRASTLQSKLDELTAAAADAAAREARLRAELRVTRTELADTRRKLKLLQEDARAVEGRGDGIGTKQGTLGIDSESAPGLCPSILLLGAMMAQRATKILELGAEFAGTTQPLVTAASHFNGHVTSVDTGPQQWWPDKHLAKHHTFVQSDSLAFLKWAVTSGEQYDLVVVDNYLDSAHVRAELQLIEKLSHTTSTSQTALPALIMNPKLYACMEYK